MTRLTESDVEDFAIECFESLGYHYIHAPDIAPDGKQPERNRYDDIVLSERLTAAVNRINPTIPELGKQQAISDIIRIQSTDTLANNE